MKGIVFVADCLRGDFFTKQCFPLNYDDCTVKTTSWDSVHGYTGPAMISLTCGVNGEMRKSHFANTYGRSFTPYNEKLCFTRAFINSLHVFASRPFEQVIKA